MEIQGYAIKQKRNVLIGISEGKISSRAVVGGEQSEIFISPGFLDIQVNGYKGIDYSDEDLEKDQVLSMVKHLAASGVTKHFPTITTAPQSRILRFIEIIKKARGSDPLVCHAIPGIHIEGPFISSEDGPRGTHDILYVRNPNLKEFYEWYEACEGLLSIVTLAPELPGAIEFIKEVSSLGVVVAIGHTAAPAELIREAINAGAKLSTHLGNGSATKIPRLQNFLWPQLASDLLSASLISDGHHLPPEVVKAFYRVKGLDNLILVSDVSPLGGFPKGDYKWGNVAVSVFADGHIGLPGTEILAGAAHLLDWDIPHFMQYTGTTLEEAVRLCTENPTKLLNLRHPSPFLNIGEDADLVQFCHNSGDKRFKIEKTIIRGEVVYSLI